MHARRAFVRLMFRLVVLRIGFLFVWATPAGAQPAPYPIIFVHGICSSGATWNPAVSLLRHASPSRYGVGGTTRVYFNGANAGVVPGTLPAADRKLFAIDLYNPFDTSLGGTFEQKYVNDVSISYKAQELKHVIDAVKAATGAPRVILVSHSMGGLVSRAYVQGFRTASDRALNQYDSFLPYVDDDVALIVTINTPHKGSSSASWDVTDSACAVEGSKNKDEMKPDDSFIDQMNRTGTMPPEVPLVSIQGKTLLAMTGDTVVAYTSMDINSLGGSYQTPRVLVQPIFTVAGTNPVLPHFDVHKDGNVIGYVNALVGVADAYWSNAPTLDSVSTLLAGPHPQQLVFRGQNLTRLTTIQVKLPGGGTVDLPMPAVASSSPTTLALTVTVMDAGAYLVRVRNQDFQWSNWRTAQITASDSAPAIDHINALQLRAGPFDRPLTISGHNFRAPVRVQVRYPGGEGELPPVAIQSVTDTAVTFLGTLANPGPYAVRLINPNGQSSNWLLFTVSPAGTAPPGVPSLWVTVRDRVLSAEWYPGPGPAPLWYVIAVGTAPGLSNVYTNNVGLQTSGAGQVAPGTYYLRVTAVGAGGTRMSQEVVASVGNVVGPRIEISLAPQRLPDAECVLGIGTPCWRIYTTIREQAGGALTVDARVERLFDRAGNLLYEGPRDTTTYWGQCPLTGPGLSTQITPFSTTCFTDLKGSWPTTPSGFYEQELRGFDALGRRYTFSIRTALPE